MGKLGSKLKRRMAAEGESKTSVQIDAAISESTHGDKSFLIEQLRKRMEKVASRHRVRSSGNTEALDLKSDFEPHFVPDADRSLPGCIADTPMGEIWINQEHFDENHRHGDEPIAGFLQSGAGLSALCRDARIASLNPLGALFIDTETTGLSGGTGTIPFLIGAGWFNEDRSFTVEHLFCRDPGEESAQLERLSVHLASATHIVSFNGKSFDMPLINTRYILNRARNPATSLPHLDLLHVCRRIFGRRLNDRSLQNMEDAVLGFRRQGDIPGQQIPAVYSEWLRGGSAKDMRNVFSHNTMDLVALTALGGVLERMYTDPEKVAHAADHLGLARSAFFVNQGDCGFAHLHRADIEGDSTDRQCALHLLAKQATRLKDYETAEKTWLQITERYPEDRDAHLALAKHFEHRVKDLHRAMGHARLCADSADDEITLHRIARIERKLNGR